MKIILKTLGKTNALTYLYTMNKDKNNGSPTNTVAQPTPAPAKTEQKPTPLEERVSKILSLQKKTQKLVTLKQTREKLSEFELGRQGEEDTLSISDSHRHEFETVNPEVIQEVVNLLKSKTANMILQTEAELLAAEI